MTPIVSVPMPLVDLDAGLVLASVLMPKNGA